MCPEAEAYVAQDTVPLREVTIGRGDCMYPQNEPWGNWCPTHALIIQLHIDGMSASEIAYHVSANRRYIYRVIKRYEDIKG